VVGVLLALLCGVGALAEAGEPAPLVETVEVRSEPDRDATGTLGQTSTSLDPASAPGAPSAMVDLVTQIPGVSEAGQGGLFQNYSVRGLSRQRVTTTVSGMRISAERRAGASASFLDPDLIGRIDVLRGPATTVHGSGALGGVVAADPRTFGGPSAGASWDGAWEEGHLFAGTGGAGWSVGAAARSAGDAEAADGSPLHSGFEQLSAAARFGWERGAQRYEITAIPALARDVAKSSTDFPRRTTDYPEERHGIVGFAVERDESWRLDLAVHGQSLETFVTESEAGLESEVIQNSVDLSLGWRRDVDAGDGWAVRYGVESFSRRDVDAAEARRDLGDPTVPPVTVQTLDGAHETETGLFAAARHENGATRWELATRWSWIEQANEGAERRTRDAWSAHAAVSRALGPRWEVSGSASTAVRFASLSEMFFQGTTGRGQVVGNPLLEPERALGLELSARHAAGSTFVVASLFGTRVDDHIERVEIAPDLRTFVNLNAGTIYGAELEGRTRLSDPWSLLWGGHWIDGEDDEGAPLADTPPTEAWIAAKRALGRFSATGGLTLRGRRDDPGHGEKPIGSAALLWAEVSLRVAPGWDVSVAASNLLDEEWYASADELAPLAPGRGVSLRVVRRGG
jgi:outer membrane receptor protein involved in Fe transport